MDLENRTEQAYSRRELPARALESAAKYFFGAYLLAKIISCSSGSRTSTPERTLDNYIKALNSGDLTSAGKLVSEHNQEFWEYMKAVRNNEAKPLRKIEDYSILSRQEIGKDKVNVFLESEGIRATITCVYENGGWKILGTSK